MPSEHDGAAFFGGVRDGADTRFGGELNLGEEAFAHIAELGQKARGTDAAGAWNDMIIFPSGSAATACSMRREPGDFGHKAFEHGHQGARDFSFGVGFGVAGMAGGAPPARGGVSARGSPSPCRRGQGEGCGTAL